MVTFAAWGLLGPEPRLGHALVNAVAVLIIARSRTILVETENAENAAARAIEETGASWIVLEVVEA